jgi:hypothetical protein
MALHQLDDICEDQRTAVLDWTEPSRAGPCPTTPMRGTSTNC